MIKPNKQDVYFFIITFATIFATVGIIKENSLFSNTLILDDLALYTGLFKEKSLYFFFYSLHNQILQNPSYVKCFYLIVYSASSLFTYIIVKEIIINKLAAFLVVLLMFLNPTTTIMILFINGSYNILFYCLFIAGLTILCLFVFKYNQFQTRIERLSLFITSCLLMSLSICFTTNGKLLPLALIALPWWKSELFKQTKKMFFIFSVGYIAFIGTFIVYGIIETFNHPYTSMLGRLSYVPSVMINHAVIILSNIINSYISPPIFTGIPCIWNSNTAMAAFAIIILCSLLIFCIVIFFSKPIRQKLINQESAKNIISSLPFIGVMLVLSIGPLTPNKIIHLWHYFLPSLFLILFICLILFTLLKLNFFYAIALFLIIISTINMTQQMRLFDSATTEQESLIEFVKSESAEWEKNCQVLIITNKTPYMSGFGFLMPNIPGFENFSRDRGFLRFMAGRPDIEFANIATADVLNQNMTAYKLDNGKTTYLYQFDFTTGRSNSLSHLLISKDGSKTPVLNQPR